MINLEQMDSDCIFMVIENRSSGSPFYLDTLGVDAARGVKISATWPTAAIAV